jgi:hypothetical protein
MKGIRSICISNEVLIVDKMLLFENKTSRPPVWDYGTKMFVTEPDHKYSIRRKIIISKEPTVVHVAVD